MFSPRRRVVLFQPLEGRRLLSAQGLFDYGPALTDELAYAAAVRSELGGTPFRVGQTIPGDIDLDGAPSAGFSGFEFDASDLDAQPVLSHTLLPDDAIHKPGGNGCTCPICALPPYDPDIHGEQDFVGPRFVATSQPLSETFNLSSLPGADKTIYLDFDGHVTTGTAWNSAYGDPIVTPAFSLDSNTSAFSDQERTVIQQVWQRVAEDFAPFNINVTTLEPPVSDLIRTNSSDQRFGIRVVIGPNTFFPSAGGVAYINSFRWNTDTPTFVFSSALGNSAKNIAEAASHEVGHTLGLFHDGRTSPAEEYYQGHGSGVTGWAPIMGVGYSRNLTQWSKGDYRAANQLQDDLAIMASANNGFGYKPDLFADAVGSGSFPLQTDADGNASIDGVIVRRNDQDTFRFAHGGGTLTVDVATPPIGANLDPELALFRDNGDNTYTLLNTDSPANRLGATITGSFPAGEYVAKVQGVGRGDPFASSPTGYTDYGSIGGYRLSLAATPGAVQSQAPVISHAFVSSSLWTTSFRNAFDTDGLGYRLDLDADNTARTLPWNNLDTLTVRFDKPVGFSDAPLVATLNGQPLSVMSNFTTSSDFREASFRLASPLGRGTAAFAFGDRVVDAGGNRSENPNFSLRILPGDTNGDGNVNISDFAAVRGAFGTTPAAAGYSLFTDFNGDGTVNISDFATVRAAFGTTL